MLGFDETGDEAAGVVAQLQRAGGEKARCAAHHVHLRQYAWREHFGKAGLARDAFYLLRPDTNVALAAGTPDPLLFDSYLHANGLAL